MLSPKLSAPSASLLRFLRSQTGVSAAPSVCAYPKRLASRGKAFSTGPSETSRWTRPNGSHGITANGTGNKANTRGRLNTQPVLSSPAPAQLTFTRHASTKSRPLLRRLFDLKRSKTPDYQDQSTPLPGFMDEGTEGMFNIGRSLSAKGTNELRIRCTEFDINGDVTLVNGEFRKQELIAKYGLLPRDLRKIDSSTLPHILIRPSAILINLLHLRVLIKADRVLVFDAYGSTDSYMQSLFIYDLEGKLRQRSTQGASQHNQTLPYEFRALEAVLISVTSGLEEEFNGVRDPVVRVLRALEEDIDRDKLRHLLIYSKKLGTFEQKARLVRDAIDDLLEADDDLAAMYLSERSTGKEREEDDHQEVEMLLESYHKVCDEIVQASGNLVTNIRNTEEVVKAILDANRNSLMLMDLKFSIGTLGLGAGTLFSALYGMNLKNFIEESDFGFGGVSITCFALTGIVCVYGLFKLRKLQRVRMWGESGVGGSSLVPLSPKRSARNGNRNNWRADSIEPIWGSLPGESRSERIRRLRENASQAAYQAASRNFKTTLANSTAAMQASANASTQASSAASGSARAESSKAHGKETGSPEQEAKSASSNKSA